MFTVLGGSGFIGSSLVNHLKSTGYEVHAPTRTELKSIIQKPTNNLGFVIYCIGLTANFRQNTYETINSHVSLLNQILQSCQYESLTYLSSTRVYQHCEHTKEDNQILVNPVTLDDLYNLSKLMGENLTLQSHSSNKVIRLSNVYGTGHSASFLQQVIRSAKENKNVEFKTSADSEKDFISIQDVIQLLPEIIQNGQSRIYNLASGMNTSNRQIADMLISLGYQASFQANAEMWKFKRINIDLINTEFNFNTRSLIDDFSKLISNETD
jgi:nucleoside-diphosphate-sugar epimerase